MGISFGLRLLIYRVGALSPLLSLIQRKIYALACRSVVAALSKFPQVGAIYTIGSYARGSFEPGLSDIEFAVFVDEKEAVVENLRKAIEQEYRRLRWVFPMLERGLWIYSGEQIERHGERLAPLMEGHLARRLFVRADPMEKYLGAPSMNPSAILTRASEIWRRKEQAHSGKYPTLFVRHILRSLRTRPDSTAGAPELDRRISATLDGQSTEEVDLPQIKWQVNAALYHRLFEIPEVAEVSIFPALDFLEDVPLEQMFNHTFNVALSLTVPLSPEGVHRWLARCEIPTGGLLYVRQANLFYPLNGTDSRRLKHIATSPLFFQLAESSRRERSERVAEEFRCPARRYAYRGVNLDGLRAINREFAERFIESRGLFTVEKTGLRRIVQHLELARGGNAAAENLSPTERIGDRSNPAAREYFEYQSRLSGVTPLPRPKASVVVITQNRAQSCLSTLRALSKMTYTPDELIIVDNASTDNTHELTQNFAAGFPVHYIFEGQVGIPHARNAGLRAASGDIVVFCDDDCSVEPDWLENLILPFRYDPNLGCVGGKIAHENTDSIVNRFYAGIFEATEEKT